VFTKVIRHRELNTEGAGLGLNICRKLTKAIGGELLVSSIVGVGTVFTIKIPLVIEQQFPSEKRSIATTISTFKPNPAATLLIPIRRKIDSEGIMQFTGTLH
jgi:hypothetical protein